MYGVRFRISGRYRKKNAIPCASLATWKFCRRLARWSLARLSSEQNVSSRETFVWEYHWLSILLALWPWSRLATHSVDGINVGARPRLHGHFSSPRKTRRLICHILRFFLVTRSSSKSWHASFFDEENSSCKRAARKALRPFTRPRKKSGQCHVGDFWTAGSTFLARLMFRSKKLPSSMNGHELSHSDNV